MKSRHALALSILLLAAALPGSAQASLECRCANGEVVTTMGDDEADCDDACADLAGSRSANRPHPNGGEEPDRNPTPDPDDEPGPDRMP